MSTLSNSILSMAASPSPVSPRKPSSFVSHIPTGGHFLHFSSVNKGFSRVLASTPITDSAFTITGSSWKPNSIPGSPENDPRSDEKGQKPNPKDSSFNISRSNWRPVSTSGSSFSDDPTSNGSSPTDSFSHFATKGQKPNSKDSSFTNSGSNWKPDSTSGSSFSDDGSSLNDSFTNLQGLVTKGQKPNVSHSTQLLYDLCKANRLKKAIRVIELMVTSGIIPDASAYTYLVNQLCKRGNVGYAMQLVEKMEDHGFPSNTVTYNALVRGLCMLGSLNQSLQFVERLMLKGLAPNAFTYSFLLEAAYKERGTDEAVKLLDEIISKGGEPNLVSYNVILTGFCKEGRTDDAMKLFRELPRKGFKPNVVSYNIMLRCLCCDGRWEEANSLLAEMDGGDRSPSVVTYNILINSLAFHGRTEQAMEVLNEMSIGNHRFRVTATSYNPVIARLCKEGKVALVVKCLDDMIYRRCKPNEGTYNAIGTLCEHEDKVQEAFYIIQSLSNKQRCCTHDFYKSVITSLCRKGNTFAAFRILYEMTRCGFDPDSATYSALIRGLCLEGMFKGAMEVLSIMEERESCNKATVDNFNAMILGFCKTRRTDLALEVFEMMVLEKKRMPNETTYAIIVEGIAHEDEMDLAKEVLEELQSRKVIGQNAVDRIVMQFNLD